MSSLKDAVAEVNALGARLQLRKAKRNLDQGQWLLVGRSIRSNPSFPGVRIQGNESFLIRMLEEMRIQSLQFVPVCSYCQKVISSQGQPFQKIEFFWNLRPGYQISHGCCNDCLQKQKQELEQFKVSKERQ